MHEKFVQADANGDGRHDLAEFKEFYELVQEEELKKHGGRGHFTDDQLKQCYDADNTLSEGEGVCEADYYKNGKILNKIMDKALVS